VELPQAIQHRCFDAVFGVTRKDGLLLGIEFVGCVEQPENAGMHQFVQVHVNRMVLVRAAFELRTSGTERKHATRERRSAKIGGLGYPVAGWRPRAPCEEARPSRIVGSNRMGCNEVLVLS
jgi:hypothetical protein